MSKQSNTSHQSQSYHQQTNNQTNHTYNNGNNQSSLPYTILPFCLKLNNKGSKNGYGAGASPSSLIQRELKGLKPSEQQDLIKRKLCQKVKALDPKLNDPSLSSTVEMLMKMQRKTQRDILNIFDDDIALMHKINEATAVLARQSSNNTNTNSMVTSPPSIHSSPYKNPNPPNALQSVPLQSVPNVLSPTIQPTHYRHPSHHPIQSPTNSVLTSPSPSPQNASMVNMNKTEYDELMNKYNGLKMENERLKSELKYSKWKWHDVYQWIIHLNNNQFMCYNQVLYDGLKRECIDGSIIKNLTVNDWQLLGLTNVNDIKCLMAEIQKLYNSPSKEEEKKEEDDISKANSNTNRHEVMTQIFGTQMQINSLQQEISMIEAKHQEQIAILSHGYNQKDAECKQYIKAIEEWQSHYGILTKEKEKLEMDYIDLDSKLIELKRKIRDDRKRNINENDDDFKEDVIDVDMSKNKLNYMEWDYQQVYLWIIGIDDGRFEKYNKIYENLKLEGIDGTCMDRLDKSDIHRIGVTNFQDKVLLLEHIKKLIGNQLTPN